MTSSMRANGPVPANAPAARAAVRATSLALVVLSLLITGVTQVAFAGTRAEAATASTHAAAPRPALSKAARHAAAERRRAAQLRRQHAAATRRAHAAARQAAHAASAPVATVTAAPASVTSTATTHHATPQPSPTQTATTQVTHHKHVSGPTNWADLNAAIARIPTYHAGDARWVIQSGSHWGTADWYTNVIYVTHSIPTSDLYSVAAHEWSHLLSVRDYDGDVNAAVDAMRKYFGGSGLLGAERAADCMAILQGATWTAYTSCTDSTWRAGARRLLNGKKLLL